MFFLPFSFLFGGGDGGGRGRGSVTNSAGKLMKATDLLPRRVLGSKYSQYVAQSFRGSLELPEGQGEKPVFR